MMWIGVIADGISKLCGVVVEEFVDNRMKVVSDLMRDGRNSVEMLRQVVISCMWLLAPRTAPIATRVTSANSNMNHCVPEFLPSLGYPVLLTVFSGDWKEEGYDHISVHCFCVLHWGYFHQM
jgi:hypothetical protein